MPAGRSFRFFVALACVPLVLVAVRSLERPAAAQNAWTLYLDDGRRSLPVRSAGNVDLVSLEALRPIFSLNITEDPAVGGLIIATRGQRIIAFPGQSFVRVGERVVSLPGQIQRERNGWWVPVEFLSAAIGPAIGTRIEVRRESRLIVVGDVRVPRVSGRVERAGAGVRLTVDVQPPAPHRITREGARLVIRFEAAALDVGAIASSAPEFAKSVRVDGVSLIVELGPSTAQYRVDETTKPGRVLIDLLPAGAPPPAPTPKPPLTLPPAVPAAPTTPVPGGGGGGVRTIVIDPGHGGDQNGAVGPGGLKEKDLALSVARRLKSLIEGRMGLRVLLTRDGDQGVPVDQRTALANNNKADLFLSLHANASLRPAVRGAQVLSLAADDYGTGTAALGRGAPVPVLGGGTRMIATVPWDLAQLPFADRSAALAAMFVEKLREQNVPMYTIPAAHAPLRVLVGANMPAVLIEMGFLTHAEEERALGTEERQQALAEALFQGIAQIRRVGTAPAGETR